ncbi:NitT/TauT family transport system substrate-binding protein [Kibdelosporangium banguiense]|uniref:NitT/TauT family transport system substrate-binding protein n=1 Tax=Kibdelosporangium banguiense TaxID=1365924 RepID=A0ABS4U3R6_9PSEU|nr:ABC transporter substrate-binding protein [Kibdelosporangium banguiense]MBP2330830.1 NitT/TauT family transport system substrate-binding protein [Kibdelosporangium banguiense]
MRRPVETLRESGSLSRRTLLAGMAGMGAFALGACSDNAGSSIGTPEVPEIRLGVLKVTDTAPLFVAEREGIFAKYGLKPRFVTMELTGDQRPDLENGQADVTFDSWVTIFLNIADNADWVVLGEAYQAGPRTTGLVTNSAVTSLKTVNNLRGKRIGVNNLKGLGVLLTNSVLATNNMKPTDVIYEEIPFDDLAGAVAGGRVSAAWMVEPYLTRSQLDNGCVLFADTASGPTADFPQSGYACARSFARKNPNTVRAFQAALAEAQQRALDRSSVENVLPEYISVSRNVAQLMSLGAFPSSTLAIRPQRVADLMLEQQFLKTRLNVTERMAATSTP